MALPWVCLGVLACGGSVRYEGAPEKGIPEEGAPEEGAPEEGAPRVDYVPSGPQVPPEGDGRMQHGGSFELYPGVGQGDSWDLCASRIPVRLTREEGAASDGLYYFRFESPLPGMPPFAPEGTDAQLAFFRGEPIVADAPLYLYFDAINLSATSPSGELSIAKLKPFCETIEPLATIPLADLDLTGSWETRCVELKPVGEILTFGMWMTGMDFAIGLDAFRFGPPCH